MCVCVTIYSLQCPNDCIVVGVHAGRLALPSGLPQGDLRPDARMLEPPRVRATVLPRDPHVPSAQEHGLQPSGRKTEPDPGPHLLMASSNFLVHIVLLVRLFLLIFLQ